MTPIYKGSGEFFKTETGAIFADDYEKNLRPVFSERFTEDVIPFTLANCSVSDSGLIGSGYAKAVYNHGTAIDYQKAVGTFVHVSGSSYGVGMGGTIAYLSGTALSIMRTGYTASGTPTATDTESITFDLVAGEDYMISLEKRACTIIAEITRLKTNETVTKTVTGYDTMCLGSPFVAIISGTNILCKRLSYYAPLYNHANCLIVGDSITEGVTQAANPTVRHSWKLMQNYFHGNCVISGVGWATTPACKERTDKLLAMGYQFDTIIFFSGTNDGGSGKTTEYYQSIIDEYTAKGIRMIWSAIPMRNGREDTMEPVRNAILATKNCGFIRLDYATLDANGNIDASLFSDGTHLNAAGYQRCYEFAVKELAALGV